MQKADHSGHRARLRKKFEDFGIEALAPHEVLEMLLFNAVPQRNTNDIAKSLLDRFGSLSSVFDASEAALMDAGLTKVQATYIRFIPQVTRLYMLDRYENPQKIINPEKVGFYLADMFIGVEHIEKVVALLVDEKNKQVFCGVVSTGDFDRVDIAKRKIMELCLNYKAVGVIVAHNHPSGMAMPSQDDYYSTIELRDALAEIKVVLIDHFIIADHEAVSMRQSGLLCD